MRSSRRLQFPDPGFDDIVVLTVDADDAVLLGEALYGLVDLSVAHPHVVVYHVHLEGSDAVFDHLGDLCDPILIPFGNGHMEAVMTAASLRLLGPFLESIHHGHAPLLSGEVQHRGGAAHDGGLGAGNEIVRRDGAAYLQVEVGMGIEEPGEHETAGAVDHLVRRSIDIPAHLDDPLPLREQVSLFHSILKNQGSVFY